MLVPASTFVFRVLKSGRTSLAGSERLAGHTSRGVDSGRIAIGELRHIHVTSWADVQVTRCTFVVGIW